MSFILFVVSLLVLFAMIASKVWEVKVRKIETLALACAKGDKKIHGWIEQGILAYKHYRKIAKLFFFDFLPSFAYEQSVKLKDYLAKRYYSAQGQFRGRRMLRDNGSVSAFLQNISDNSGESHKKA
jgi:hypothetical protein